MKRNKKTLSYYKRELNSFLFDGFAFGFMLSYFIFVPKTLTFTLGFGFAAFICTIVQLIFDIRYLYKESKYEKRKKTKK